MVPLPSHRQHSPVHVYPPTDQANSARRRKPRGFSLIEAMTTVTIVGILAAMSTYTVRERINESKSAEAITMLGGIRKGIANSTTKSWLSSDGVVTVGDRVTGFGGPLGGLTLLGKPKNDVDGDGNHGHGDNDGCDPSNPAGCNDKGGGSDGGGNNKDGDTGGGSDGGNGPNNDTDGDGNHGHGDSDGCDPSNPAGCNGNSGGGDNGGGGNGGGSDAAPNARICGSADPIPESFNDVQGRAYQSSPSDWDQGDAKNSWACLRVTQEGLQHYQYGYDVGGPRAGMGVPIQDLPADVDENQSFTAWARGDLDGDGRFSWFVLQGASLDGQVYTAPSIGIVDQAE